MDYMNQSVFFKAQKVARYTRLYGPARTVRKVRGQLHSRRNYSVLPEMESSKGGAHVGLIGCGNFAYTTIAHYLTKNFGPVIRGTMDVNINRAASLASAYGCEFYTTDADRLLMDPVIDVVFIASNHASHAEYAIAALEHGKSVHIEKPPVVSFEQLHRLCDVMMRSDGRVAMGFNRPDSGLGREVRRIINAEDGPASFDWFVAGHEIEEGHWYFSAGEGGRILGNLCHWIDFLYRMMETTDMYPIEVVGCAAFGSASDFAVMYRFGEGSMGTITFSAKGHAFEGVKERLSSHRGDAIVCLDDFNRLRANVGRRRVRRRTLFREHGHENRVRDSYGLPTGAGTPCSVQYVWETNELALATRTAVETGAVQVVRGWKAAHPS